MITYTQTQLRILLIRRRSWLLLALVDLSRTIKVDLFELSSLISPRSVRTSPPGIGP